MAGRMGAPNAGRIPASAFYQFNGDIYAPAADAFFNLPYKSDAIQEIIYTSDAGAVSWSASTSISDTFQFAETYLEFLVTFFADVDEQVEISETSFTGEVYFYRSIDETSTFSDIFIANNLFKKIITQGQRFWENLSFVPNIPLNESFSTSDALSLDCVRVVELLDGLIKSDLLSAKGTYVPTQSDVVTITTDILLGAPLTVTENLTLADVLSLVRGVRVLEQLGFNLTTLANSIRRLSFLDQFRILDSLRKFLSEAANDTIGITEISTPKFFLTRTALENIAVTETLSNSLIIRLTAQDHIDLQDIDVLKYIFRPILNEDIQITAAYVSPGQSFTSWAVNSRTGAVTEYTNYNFNSFAAMGNKYLAASDSGLYELNGDDDQGTDIIARIKSGLMQMGGAHFTSFKAAYLGLRGNGDWVFKLETGDGKEYVYSIVAQDMQTTKVRLGKGLRSRYFAFELISTGQDFDMDSVEFIPLIATRRV